MRVTLLGSSWLKRSLRVETPDGPVEVVYDGRGIYEAVYVDGHLADQRTNWTWFAPFFVFPLGDRPAAIEVRVTPWLTIRSFHLLVEDEVLYAEGEREPYLPPGWHGNIRGRWEATRLLFEELTRRFSAQPADGRIRKAGDNPGVQPPGPIARPNSRD
jgi:hypothetical protein